jgi:cysteine desulfurase
MFPGLDGAAMVALLDRAGVRCSQSSACTSSRPEPSYVLRAMGLSEEEAFASVRFSFSNQNTMAEAEAAAAKVISVFERLSCFEGRQTAFEKLHGAVNHEV